MRVSNQPGLHYQRSVTYRPVELVPTRSSDDLPPHYPARVSRSSQYPTEHVYEGELLRPTRPVPSINTSTVAPPVFAADTIAPGITSMNDLRNRAVAAYLNNSLRPDLMGRRTGQVVDEFA